MRGGGGGKEVCVCVGVGVCVGVCVFVCACVRGMCLDRAEVILVEHQEDELCEIPKLLGQLGEEVIVLSSLALLVQKYKY